MKKTYYIEYWDKYFNKKSTFIKAKSIEDAEYRFYKQNPTTLITKTSQNW